MKKLLTTTSVFVVLLASAMLFSGCQNSGPPTDTASANVPKQSETTKIVTLKNSSFAPHTLNIKEGEEVTWVNGDGIIHTVTIKNLTDSGAIQPGNSYNYRFEKAGKYEYTCTIHPSMTGIINVE